MSSNCKGVLYWFGVEYRHGTLPFYFENISVLYHGVSAQTIHSNSPGLMAIASWDYHFHELRTRSFLDTKAVIVLHNSHRFNTFTKETKLIYNLTIVKICVRPTQSDIYDPSNFIKSIWLVNSWVIDIGIHASASLAVTSIDRHTTPNTTATET